MERLLIYPPFADPTQPYLSLPTLKGHLRSRGLDARVVDLNVGAAHHLFHPESVDDLARRLGLRFLRLNRASHLRFEEAREYRALADARAKIEWVLAADPPLLDVFRRRELFFDPSLYSLARRRVEAFFDALSAVHYPYRYGFHQAAHDVLPWTLDLLDAYWRRRQSPLDAFYREVFAEPCDWEALEDRIDSCPLGEAEFVGISVVFPSQIPEAFYLCRLIRELSPVAFLALGGPWIHQTVARVEEPVRARILELVDGVGIAEGEETLEALFPRLESWRHADGPGERAEVLREVPNLLLRDPGGSGALSGPPRLLDLREASPPDYSDLALDRYLAPDRTLLYAPTRGCYWNQCSFCHYGLSEEGTAPYREVPPARAASQLAQLSRRHGVKNFTISCDVLSPAYAVRLAEALIQKRVKIRWSSDLKIERSYTPERCQLLYRSGLRAAAFGMESGSDRMLELIRKGCDRETLTRVNRAFHSSGVATQWMTFTDHPGERVEEALETVRWIEAETDVVDLFVVGEFGLELGSDVARNPARYGVTRIFHAVGDELRLHALYETETGSRSVEERGRIDALIRRVGSSYALRPYPWAGAISTHHTLLHFLELGQRAFRVHFQRAGAANDAPLGPPPPSHIAGLRERARFSVERIAEVEREFFDRYLAGALRPAGSASDLHPTAPLSLEHYREAVDSVPPIR